MDYSYHERQYDEVYESTKSFLDFVEAYSDTGEPLRVLDLPCGGGANTYHMTQRFPNWEFTGADIDEKVLDIARESKNKRAFEATFLNVDIEDSVSEFGENSFDIVTSMQFLLHYDSMTDYIETCCTLASDDVFITALFSEDWYEQKTVVNQFEDDSLYREDGLLPYNIYSLSRLEEELSDIVPGANLNYEPFEIDIDLQQPETDQLGTYTRKTVDGERLQISGYMLMPWYNVHVSLPD
jgi:SAM-dependent methyltransferase